MSKRIYHNHHIIPRHAGGTDDPSNIVRLTVEEHAEAHRILYEKHGRIEDKIAWKCLSGKSSETEADFHELLDAVTHLKFQRLGVFPYSHEDNTHSFTLEDSIPEDEKQHRANQLMEAQMDVSLEFNQSLVGTSQKVLFDRLEGDHFVGRTQFDSPDVDNEVLVPAENNYVRMGDFATVKITDATHYDLNGILI